jgi:tetratricopeptide (TPR) repeat protein
LEKLMNVRPVAVLAGTAMIVAASYAVHPLRGDDGTSKRASDTSSVAAAGEGVLIPGTERSTGQEVERLIGSFEGQVRDHPNASGFDFLARMYAIRGRLTGDVATYGRAEEASRRALRLAPDDVDAKVLLAATLYTTHDFAGALDLARAVVREHPTEYRALATQVDAELELGHYDDARRSLAILAKGVDGSPSVAIRQARLAFLDGDVERARVLAATAEDEARSSGVAGNDLAYYQSTRGQIELDSGNYDAAAQLYRGALDIAVDRIGLDGLARAEAARGHADAAIALYERSVNLVPEPAALAAINRALVLFDANHRVDAGEAVALADAELSVRRDVYGLDAAAWAHYAAGDIATASTLSREALALGTRDASIQYHAGMIAAAAQDSAAAVGHLRTALQISPQFDVLQAPRARAELEHLERPTQ